VTYSALKQLFTHRVTELCVEGQTPEEVSEAIIRPYIEEAVKEEKHLLERCPWMKRYFPANAVARGTALLALTSSIGQPCGSAGVQPPVHSSNGLAAQEEAAVPSPSFVDALTAALCDDPSAAEDEDGMNATNGLALVGSVGAIRPAALPQTLLQPSGTPDLMGMLATVLTKMTKKSKPDKKNKMKAQKKKRKRRAPTTPSSSSTTSSSTSSSLSSKRQAKEKKSNGSKGNLDMIEESSGSIETKKPKTTSVPTSPTIVPTDSDNEKEQTGAAASAAPH